MTEFDDVLGCYSDLHKDVYGYRPRGMTGWTLQDFQNAIEELQPKLKVVMAEEAAAVIELESRIATLIKMGASNRDAAIRWIADAEECTGDMGFLCYKLGVPYGYC